MVKKTHLKDTIFFLCSPSLGILDNWLPIIWKLKKKQKDYKFIIIFPRSNFINQINLSNILLILGSNVFDSIVFKSDSGLWLINDSLNISFEGLLTRDKIVLSYFKKQSIPVSTVIGGGYSDNNLELAKRHTIIFQATQEIFN